MNKKSLIQIVDNRRILYYQPIPKRKDGVVAVLVGYTKAGKTHWY